MIIVLLFLSDASVIGTLPMCRGGYNGLLISNLNNDVRELRKKCRVLSCVNR